MWQLFLKCRTLGQLPSRLLGLTNSWAAYQIDNAVVFFGITIENALQERTKIVVGSKTEYQDKYTLPQLLHEDFRLPLPEQKLTVDPMQSFLAQLNAYAEQPGSNVKRWEYVGPMPGDTSPEQNGDGES